MELASQLIIVAQKTAMCFLSTLLPKMAQQMALRCSRSLGLPQHPAGPGSAAPPSVIQQEWGVGGIRLRNSRMQAERAGAGGTWPFTEGLNLRSALVRAEG